MSTFLWTDLSRTNSKETEASENDQLSWNNNTLAICHKTSGRNSFQLGSFADEGAVLGQFDRAKEKGHHLVISGSTPLDMVGEMSAGHAQHINMKNCK